MLSMFALRAQETLPVYSDYLSDNIYLLHPAAAGIGSCSKLRITHRQQWTNSSDFPSLQTLSFHTKVGDKTGLGFIFLMTEMDFIRKQVFKALMPTMFY